MGPLETILCEFLLESGLSWGTESSMKPHRACLWRWRIQCFFDQSNLKFSIVLMMIFFLISR